MVKKKATTRKGRRAGQPDRAALARQTRVALDLTQRELADLLGVPQPTVARWETGVRDPGAVGEALFRLLLDSPRRGKTVLGGVTR
jgi:DNA-binding transcriptional regulator YiaG